MVDQQLVEQRWGAARRFLAKDPASCSRGVEIAAVTEDAVEVVFVIGEDDANGVGIAHGGLSYFLADTAVGIAANLGNVTNVTSSATITYLAAGPLGDKLRAVCTGPIASAGRTSVYSTTVSRSDGQLIVVVQSTMMALGRPRHESES
ncbi:PaaI family thioesterase [Arthrobacter sp. PAMC25564]|uniref:PaaI family thioesterase n=1 Tax=Arthrobacter sp. PAMC25564 TaxID=2565366 RepID=UPI001445DE58|nr:PaaI family thioesterase [Arthrobacter sp. PAMC25564]